MGKSVKVPASMGKAVAVKAAVPTVDAVNLPKFVCLRCGHRWHPRKEEKPLCCGFCKSPYWDTAALSGKESAARERHLSCAMCPKDPKDSKEPKSLKY